MAEPVAVASPVPPTDQTERDGADDAQASGGSWGSRVPALLIVALLAATAVGAVALQRRDDTPTYAAPQIGWMSQGCTQWAASARASGTAVGADWCASMASWMNAQMGQGPMGPGQMGPGQMGPGQMGPGQMGPGQMGQMGQGQMGQGRMTGTMMWQSPESMQATCQQWASSGTAPAAEDAQARCAQMVAWMAGHMGDWGAFMANGPMMVPSTTS